MKNTFSLVRISTSIQSEENGGTGIPFQKEKLSQYATLNDLNLVKTITDIASGGLETRAGIEELKTHIENGDVDVVLIWNVSRAFRSMIYFTKFYEYLKNHNVELISVSEGLRSSRKEHQMVFEIMMSVAAYEKSIIKSRLSSGRKMKVKMGVRGFGGTLPLGYSKYSDGEIRPDGNSVIVNYIFKKMNSLNKRNLTKTKKTQTLLKLLRQRDFTYHGKPFKKWNIKTILSNRFYIGELNYGSINSNHNYDTFISKRLFNQIRVVS